MNRLSGTAARSNSSAYTLQSTTGGYTIAGLIVTIFIISLISSLVVFDHQSFSRVVELKNETQDVALAVREAQVKGLAVEGYGGSFQQGYGVHIELSGGTENYRYDVFVDNGDTEDEYDTNDTVIRERTLEEGYQLSRVCPDTGGSCGPSGESGELTIIYRRPRPDALVRINGSETDGARIELTPTDGDPRTGVVIVRDNGRVQVTTETP